MSNISIEGNLAADPELRFTPDGTAVADLLVLENRRVKNSAGEYEDGPPTRHRLVVWGDLAQNATESLTKGARVVATAELYTEQWADKTTGEARYTTKARVTSLGVSLRHHTAQPIKTTRDQ